MSVPTFDFSSEVLTCRDALRYFALTLTKNHDDADDLVQETMLKALVYHDHFTAHTNLKAWLFTIMKNVFINDYRKNKKMKTVMDSSTDLLRLNTPGAVKADDPESRFHYRQICDMISSLESDYGQPLQLYFEGYKYREIAERLNVPIGTVKSRIFLARQMMIERLEIA